MQHLLAAPAQCQYKLLFLKSTYLDQQPAYYKAESKCHTPYFDIASDLRRCSGPQEYRHIVQNRTKQQH
jgi:hypothetical protein